ncbi:response regulator transcription factor [Variovorax sp. Root411]|uniref:response regulator transcription factor n=1 Tax=Variovorax sp. Root411 TaxID=1736530 RepID=UPI0006F77EF5|nr:response regulator transcription factor [Variovorax sp. Root411]KQW54342.1 hypothetical protein ASC92_20120 [Variovorax sp. Root411]
MNQDPAHAPSTDIDHCVHEVRNALAAIASASEVLARIEPPHELAREAGMVVQRQAHQLSCRIGELIAHAQRAGPSHRVLAVSDDAHLLATLGGMLAAQGCRVDFAASSEEGLRALLPREHEAAVIDVRTSKGKGLGLGHRARSAGFEGRMVAVWSAHLPDRQQHGEGVAGFDAVLTRAFESAALRATLAQA